MEAPDKKSWSIPSSSDRIGFNDSGVFLHKDGAMAQMDAHVFFSPICSKLSLEKLPLHPSAAGA